MNYLPLNTAPREGGTDPAAPAVPELRREYRAGRGVGVIRLGERRLFFRRLLSVYYIPYREITRYFRRVETVPARIGCCTGDVRVENLVLCGGASGGERELAQIQLPGERAALALMEELRRLAPDAAVGKPGAGKTASPVQTGGAS